MTIYTLRPEGTGCGLRYKVKEYCRIGEMGTNDQSQDQSKNKRGTGVIGTGD